MAETATPTPRARAKRKGNGPGHGGPAKGVGKGAGWGGPPKGLGTRPAITAATQPTPEAKAAGQAKARTARELSQPHVPAMVEVWRSIALDPDAPPAARVVAAEKLVDRAEGKAVQSSQMLGADGKPVDPRQQTVTVVDERPPIEALIGAALRTIDGAA